MAIGSGATVIVVYKMVVHAIRHPEEAPARITERVRNKLDLTDEQAAKVKEIVARRQKAIQAIRREMQPRIEKEVDGARDEVAALLDPEKARKWRERVDLLKDTWLPAPPRDSSE
jgi:hypothetical protein